MTVYPWDRNVKILLFIKFILFVSPSTSINDLSRFLMLKHIQKETIENKTTRKT